MAHFTTILCDLDGTLIDSQRDIAVAFQHALRTVVAEHVPAESAIARHIGKPLAQMAVELGYDLPAPQLELFLHTYRQYYAQHCAHHTRPYPGVIATLQALIVIAAWHCHHQTAGASRSRARTTADDDLFSSYPGLATGPAAQTGPRYGAGNIDGVALPAARGVNGWRYSCRYPGRQSRWHQDVRRDLRIWDRGGTAAMPAGLCDWPIWGFAPATFAAVTCPVLPAGPLLRCS